MAKNPTFENIPVFYLQNFPGLFDPETIKRFQSGETDQEKEARAKYLDSKIGNSTLPKVKQPRSSRKSLHEATLIGNNYTFSGSKVASSARNMINSLKVRPRNLSLSKAFDESIETVGNSLTIAS